MMTQKKKKTNKCPWCKGYHEYSQSYCFVKNERKLRSKARPRVRGMQDLWDDEGKLRSEFINTDVEDKLYSWHTHKAVDALMHFESNGYKVPNSVRYMLDQGFVSGQITREKPFAVYILSEGKHKRRLCTSLWDAVEFHKVVREKYPSSGIVSIARSYDLPADLRLKRDKLPKKFKWCPQCATFRVFIKVSPPEQFHADIKRWSEDKRKYVWTNRLLWLTKCQLCGFPNRHPIFRRSNQPFHVQRVKAGKTRTKSSAVNTPKSARKKKKANPNYTKIRRR